MKQVPMNILKPRLPTGPLKLNHFLWLGRVIVTLSLVVYLGWRLYQETAGIPLHLAHPGYLALALAGAVLGVLMSAQLWYGLILAPIQVTFRQILAHYLHGLFWNNFLPTAFGGDAVRVLSLRSVVGQTGLVVNSVLMARLAGLWSMAILAGIMAQLGMIWLGWPADLPSILVAAGTLALTAAGTIFLFGAPMIVLLKRLSAPWQRWHASLQAYRQHKARLWQALGWAFAIQVCAMAINIFTAKAFDLPIAPGEVILCLPLINLVAMMPVSIGGFGVREGAYVYFLGLFGIGVAAAIWLALAVYAILILVAGVGAGIFTLLMPPASKDSTAI